jgi:CRP/FNR family transcriptional regulator, cyclic AMP receptor protein
MQLHAQRDLQRGLIDFLRTMPLFDEVDEDGLTTIACDIVPEHYPRNTIIFWQDDPGTALYLIQKGKVRIFKSNPAGNETSINIFSTGNTIGELALLDNQPRSATAKTITACTLLRLERSAFLGHMATLPGLALGVARMLALKLRWTAAFAETIAQYDAAGRLLHILLLYNEQLGKVRLPGKAYELDLGLNQDDLASLVGARREWVNRLLQAWKRKGIVEYASGKLLIHDLPRALEERDRRVEGSYLTLDD